MALVTRWNITPYWLSVRLDRNDELTAGPGQSIEVDEVLGDKLGAPYWSDTAPVVPVAVHETDASVSKSQSKKESVAPPVVAPVETEPAADAPAEKEVV